MNVWLEIICKNHWFAAQELPPSGGATEMSRCSKRPAWQAPWALPMKNGYWIRVANGYHFVFQGNSLLKISRLQTWSHCEISLLPSLSGLTESPTLITNCLFSGSGSEWDPASACWRAKLQQLAGIVVKLETMSKSVHTTHPVLQNGMRGLGSESWCSGPKGLENGTGHSSEDFHSLGGGPHCFLMLQGEASRRRYCSLPAADQLKSRFELSSLWLPKPISCHQHTTLLLLFGLIFFYVCECLACICMCTIFMLGAHRDQKGASDPLDLEL